MAGVYIPKLKKVKSCDECAFLISNKEYSVCAVKIAIFLTNEYKPGIVDKESCPLVEVPDHGDLIDVSEKVDVQYYNDNFGKWSIKTKTVGEILAEVCAVPLKVVIPVDKGEKEEI